MMRQTTLRKQTMPSLQASRQRFKDKNTPYSLISLLYQREGQKYPTDSEAMQLIRFMYQITFHAETINT